MIEKDIFDNVKVEEAFISKPETVKKKQNWFLNT